MAKKVVVKKKMASPTVVKKKDLKKKGAGKTKKAKGPRHKTGRKWHYSGKQFLEKGSLLAKVMAAFRAADDNVIGENDLITTLVKAGVKDDGKKTVKRMTKALVRNLSRAGVIVKDRGRVKVEEEDDETEEVNEDDDEEVDDEETDTGAEEKDDEVDETAIEKKDDEDEEDEDEDEGEEVDEEKPTKKKKTKKKVAPKKK